MRTKSRKSSFKTGQAPGSVVFTGEQKVDVTLFNYLNYNENEIEEAEFDNHKPFLLNNEPSRVNWYDVRGIHDNKIIEEIGNKFSIHSLVLEDVVDIYQRPKYEEYEDGILLILKSITFNREDLAIEIEHIGIYFKEGLVVSFQEDHSDVFKVVRARIHSGKGRIRRRGADYLAYALGDLLVDHFYTVLEFIDEEIQKLEDILMGNISSNIREDIHHLKKQSIFIRKLIVPTREAISKFSKSENELIQENSTIYLRDLYDHTVQIMDMVDSNRDILNGLQDLYLSEISFKMNQVMQILTIITIIFIPLSFLAGVYGMNFEIMPELKYKYGYFILLGIMLIIAISLIFWFKKKKWL